MLLREGAVEEGLNHLEQSIVLGDVRALYPYARMLGELGRVDDAMKAYRQLIERDPNHAEAHCNLADWCRQRGDLEEAVRLLRRGHALGSKRAGWPYPSHGWLSGVLCDYGISVMQDEPKRALDLWKEAIDAHPENSLPYLFTAVQLLRADIPDALKDLPKALFHAQIANRLTNRKQVTHLQVLGNALEANGFLHAALACAEETLACLNGKDQGPVTQAATNETIKRLRDLVTKEGR
jgi:tetratricopeptide (TPR) repeat protein